jgi:hypothetical protein
MAAAHPRASSTAGAAVIRVRRDVHAAAAASLLPRGTIEGAATIRAQLTALAAGATLSAVRSVARGVYAGLAALLETGTTGEPANPVFAGRLAVRGRVTTEPALSAMTG